MIKWQSPSNPPDTGRPALLWVNSRQYVRPDHQGAEPLVGYYTPKHGWQAPDTQAGGFWDCEPMFWAEIEPPTND